MRPIRDSRFRASIPNPWASLCTIVQKQFTLSAVNQPIETGSYPLIDGMVAIPCLMSTEKSNENRDESRRDSPIESKYSRIRCRLNGYFPDIKSRSMAAQVDGIVWQIRGIEYDSQKLCTILILERING